jgi:hypothetical protein
MSSQPAGTSSSNTAGPSNPAKPASSAAAAAAKPPGPREEPPEAEVRSAIMGFEDRMRRLGMGDDFQRLAAYMDEDERLQGELLVDVPKYGGPPPDTD